MNPLAPPLSAREARRLAENDRSRAFRRKTEAFWTDFRALTAGPAAVRKAHQLSGTRGKRP